MIDKKRENLIAYGLVIIGAIVYISLIFNENVWLDEAFTATLIRGDMQAVLARSMADTLPPLYNIILKLATDIFGYSVPVMKATSVAPMIITMLLSATVVRKRHGLKVSSLYTIALFTMPNLLFFGVEIRMYSLGFMFATASAIYAYEFICDFNKKNFLIFTIVSVLAGYSHHFAFVSVGVVYFFMLLYYIFVERDKIKRWFFCLLLTFALYFPCLVVTLKQFKSVSGYFSMPEITPSVFIKYARYPYTVGNTVCSIVLLICTLALFCFAATKAIKKKELSDMYAICMFLVYYIVLIFGTVISKVMTANIFVDRYLLFAHGMLWLFFAMEAGQFKKYYYVFAGILIACGIFGYAREYGIEYGQSPDELINILTKETGEGDVLYTIEDNEEMAFCLVFYDDNLTNYEDLDDAIDAMDRNKSDMWITIMDYEENYDLSELKKHGLVAEFVGTYSFDRYTFDMYKVAYE